MKQLKSYLKKIHDFGGLGPKNYIWAAWVQKTYQTQSYGIFWDIIIFLESFYHSGENEVLSVKNVARVLDLHVPES